MMPEQNGRSAISIAVKVLIITVAAIVAVGIIIAVSPNSENPTQTESTIHTLSSASSFSAISLSSSSPSNESNTKFVVTVQLDKTLYVGNQTIGISGRISPIPSSMLNLTIEIRNPGGNLVASGSTILNAGMANYSYSAVPSGLSCGWVSGTYSIIVSWAGSGQVVTTFIYEHAAPGVASSSTTSTSCSTSTTP